jgi:hypothetical protein
MQRCSGKALEAGGESGLAVQTVPSHGEAKAVQCTVYTHLMHGFGSIHWPKLASNFH